jgi:Mrp family chromosome partitioning ATPase/capsular polysaccharide biosynthesis protein
MDEFKLRTENVESESDNVAAMLGCRPGVPGGNLTFMTDSFPSASERQGHVRYIQALRRHVRLIATLVVVAVAAAALYSFLATKQYEASADLLVQPLPPGDEDYQGFSLFRESFNEAAPVVTAARLINSRQVRDPVFERLGRAADGASVSVQPLGQANIVTITSTAPEARQAARVADGFADGAVRIRTQRFQAELAEAIKRIERQIAAIPLTQRPGNFEFAALQERLAKYKGLIGTADPTIVKLTNANIPGAPSWPRPLLSIIVAFVVALLLGVGIAMFLELVDPRISSEDELLLEHRLPILARIPRLPKDVAQDYLTGKGSMPSGAWKGYSLLRAVLTTLGPNGEFPRSILVTSPSPGDGKTTTAANLAITLAASNMNVILVDCDLHRPMVATVFNVPPRRGGVVGLLFDKSVPETQLVNAPAHPRLRLLLANQTHGLGARVDRERMTRMLDQLGELCDVVVVDSPPVAEVPEVLDMAEAVDTVLLTVRLGKTRREPLFRARELFSRRGVSPSGFVVTTREAASKSDSYGYSSYVDEPPELQVIVDGPAERSRQRTLRLTNE